jgi:DNA-directed RNA polymerase specialized sigma24 family protein
MAKAKSVFLDGVEYRSIRELAEAYDLNYRTVANRMARCGQTPEEAIGLKI